MFFAVIKDTVTTYRAPRLELKLDRVNVMRWWTLRNKRESNFMLPNSKRFSKCLFAHKMICNSKERQSIFYFNYFTLKLNWIFLEIFTFEYMFSPHSSLFHLDCFRLCRTRTNPIARKKRYICTRQKFIMNDEALIPGVSRYIVTFGPRGARTIVLACLRRVFAHLHARLGIERNFFFSRGCNHYK